MAAGVALHDNFNPIEDLMKVNNIGSNLNSSNLE